MPDEAEVYRGHCLCGAISWAAEGPLRWAAHCHCESCRRNCGAGIVSFIGAPTDGFRWTGGMPASYASSPGVTRSFCATCGSPVAFEAERYPGEIHLYAAQLDDMAMYAPQMHVHWSERVPWLSLNDDLRKR